MRVALLVTGKTELHGLPDAWRSLFPGHDFYAVAELSTATERRPYNGFTSSTLRAEYATSPQDHTCLESAFELIGRAVQEALGDRHQPRADAVVILDDLELVNAGQEALVARVFRAVVEKHLAGLNVRAAAVTAEVLRERVSFHLIVPMIEAWFFGDPAALALAGVPAASTPVLVAGDLETFETNDPGYLAATAASCPCWTTRGQRRDQQPKWLGSLPRQWHPKGYLQWLCIDGNARTCTNYDETGGGVGALRALSWAALLANPLAHLRYLRAFLADLAGILGASTLGPISEDTSALAPATRLSTRPRNNVLRNL